MGDGAQPTGFLTIFMSVYCVPFPLHRGSISNPMVITSHIQTKYYSPLIVNFFFSPAKYYILPSSQIVIVWLWGAQRRI